MINKKQLTIEIDHFLQRNFPKSILERGFVYYQNGHVTKMEIKNDKLLAKVSGTATYDVDVHLEKLSLSTCNCPYEANCKHLVAVFYELQKLLDKGLTLAPVIANAFHYCCDEPNDMREQLKKDLAPYVKEIYHLLSKSGHFSNEHLIIIVKQFFEELQAVSNTKCVDQLQIMAMTVVIEELYKKAIDYETYRFRQNRFITFFNELLHFGHPMFKREVLRESNFYHWYTNYLFKQIKEDVESSPLEKIMATWLLCEEKESSLQTYGEMLLNEKTKSNHFFVTKLASLLFLQGNDGARSLTLLKDIKSLLHHSDLIDHFLIMEQKNDFIMMKHWFDLFFPYEKPKQGTVLGKLFEEMLVETGTSKEKITIVWKNWLEQPSFSTYKSRIKRSSNEEKQQILDFILPSLQKDLYRSQTEGTYYQIILEERLYRLGIQSLLTSKKDIFTMTPEIEKLLKMIMKEQPELLLPFYHQLVERLVQKKSRAHYEEAAYYIQQLKTIYKAIKKETTYQAFYVGLKQRFKTFRAFIQELNKLDK